MFLVQSNYGVEGRSRHPLPTIQCYKTMLGFNKPDFFFLQIMEKDSKIMEGGAAVRLIRSHIG